MSRRRLPITPHLPPEQIARRYRSCRQGVEKTHWQVLWLMTRPEEPLTPAQAAHQVGLTAGRVRTLSKRWNAEGPVGLADRRALTDGGHPELTPEQQATLCTRSCSDRPRMAGCGPGRRSSPTSTTAGA